MWRILLILCALALVLAVPFLLKPRDEVFATADDELVIISPHNEAIRFEFTHAFREYYLAKTGRTIRLDWRTPGGTSEIARYIAGEFLASFRRHWEKQGHAWTSEVEEAFDNPSLSDRSSSVQQAARAEFLNSAVGIGIDLFFGGGAFDFIQQANAGRLASTSFVQDHPAIFSPDSIPEAVSGEPLYDSDGRWFGVCLASFGICYNPDVLRRLDINEMPASWEDLADPRLFGQIALADPTKSGSAAKAYEMVIQQQMQREVKERGEESPEILSAGWKGGLQLIQKIAANARYFTDSASQVPVDVSQGNAAAGMCIDFYGRFQSDAVRVGEHSRLRYFTPAGGSSVGADPIAMLRGAPNREQALAFMEFCLLLEGQKLWNFKKGEPGGPVRYNLRRLPIRRELYAKQYERFVSDPGVDPYAESKDFVYRPAWTAPLFGTLRFIIKVMCLDPEEELTSAWRTIIRSDKPPEALARFSDVSAVSYERAFNEIRPVLRASDRVEEVRLGRQLGIAFRRQYEAAEQLAKEKR